MDIDKIKEDNKINKDLIETTMEQMFHSIFDVSDKISAKKLSIKEELIEDYLRLTQKMLTAGFLKSDKEKIRVMDLVDRLNTQIELIEIIKSHKSESHLTDAAKRLYKRAQSSFE